MNNSMKGYLRFVSLMSLALFALGWIVISAASQSPQSNQQRPRTVGGNQNTSPASNQQQSNSSGEEVDEGDVVRVETQLVSVPAVVTDKSGRPLSTLRQDDFVVLEDGKPQHLTNFATTEAPFEIALLLDTSGSTREELGLIRDAANAFLNALRPGRSEEHTSELQSQSNLVCRLLLEKKKKNTYESSGLCCVTV